VHAHRQQLAAPLVGQLLASSRRRAMNFLTSLFRRKTQQPSVDPIEDFASPATRRLAHGALLLQHIDVERKLRGDSSLGKATEDRIIWRELFDLELQEVDEQITRRIRESDWA
jgi:hypothetical protein